MKTLRYLLTSFFLLLLAIGSYFWVTRHSIVTRFLSYNLSSEVEISAIHLTFHSLILEGVKIKNPKRTAVSDALEIEKVVVTCFPLEFFKKKINIQRLSIQSPKIRLEYYNEIGSENNWALLFSSMIPAEKPKLFEVDYLDILNLQFWATDSEGRKIGIWPIPYIQFEGIGHKKAVTLPQLIRVIFQTVLMQQEQLPAKSFSTLAPLSPEFTEGVNSNLEKLRSPK